MKIDVNVIYERELRWSKWVWLNRIIGGWYLSAAIAASLLCVPAVLLLLLMTGRSCGTMLKRIGSVYERLIG